MNPLHAPFYQKMKKPQDSLLGIEEEWLGFCKRSEKPACYEGERGIEVLFENLLPRLPNASPVREHGHLLGMILPEYALSLEPGAQVEISTQAVRDVRELEDLVAPFFHLLHEEAAKLDLIFLPTPLQPFASPKEVCWIPKARYAIMAPYLQDRGRLAHWMMKATGSLQVCLDFSSPEDARKKFILAQSLTPYLSALSSSSFLLFGRKTRVHYYRGKIWWHTDRARTRFLKRAHSAPDLFSAYTDYALSTPLMFLYREGSWYTPPPLTYAEYLKKGAYGFAATMEDWMLHLNGLFPPVRLREYLEIRCFDIQPLPYTLGVVSLLKGIFYSSQLPTALDTFYLPYTDLVGLYKKVWTEGIYAQYRSHDIRSGLTQLFQLAEKGLSELRAEGRSSHEEKNYLEFLSHEFLSSGSLRERMAKELPDSFTLADLTQFYCGASRARALSV